MAYMALYRKWRPQTFDDCVGQGPVITALRNQILYNRVGHAYLFCGTRGTGKTSTAKIFARAVNCLNPQNGNPCNECELCREAEAGFNLIEIDAASNNGVDNIREIVDEVSYSPAEGKYKVYIIEDADTFEPVPEWTAEQFYNTSIPHAWVLERGGGEEYRTLRYPPFQPNKSFY